MSRASGSFEVTSWTEDAYEHVDGGGRLTRAVVEQKFSGAVDGDGAVQWLMAYSADGRAHFVGIQRITGSLAGRTGSAVFETIGEFDGETATGRWTVVPGSGTSGFRGLSGSGSFSAPHGPRATYQLDYAFA